MTVAGEPMSMEYLTTSVYRRENGVWKVVHHHADRNVELIEKMTNTGA